MSEQDSKDPVYIMSRATPDQVRDALVAAGLEVVVEGGIDELARFFSENAPGDQPPGPVAVTWLGQIRPKGDRSIFTLEGSPVSIAADPRLVDTLVELVTSKVQENGFCALDMDEFGLSSETARSVAAQAGVHVVTGRQAVFASPTLSEESN